MKEQIKALRAEADRLERKATLLAAYNTLRSISGEEFQMRRSLDFPVPSKWRGLTGLCKAIETARREIALELGHTKRVDLLVSAGMDRERAEISDLITDETAAECFATWLFDHYGQFDPEWHSGVHVDYEKCPLGFQFWKEGKHDM